jgi:hypothetical protein
MKKSQIFQTKVDEQPDNSLFRFSLGQALHAGRPSEAKPILEKALNLAVEQHHDDPAEELRALIADL